MAYPRPGDRLGGYPMGAELGGDGPSAIGGMSRGYRSGGGYVQQPGYGVSSYESERGRPVGGAYAGGASDYYAADRPGAYGYEREGYGRDPYGREGLVRDGLAREGFVRDGLAREGYASDPYGREGLAREGGYGRDPYGRQGFAREGYAGEGYVREGYVPSAYDQGYARQPQMVMEPPIEYVESMPSDLGAGLRDAGRVSRHHPSDYAAGYGGASGYGAAAYEEDEVSRLKKELAHERRQKHELEVAAAGAVGYGLHERRKKIDEEDFDDLEPKKEKKRFHFFSRD